MSTPQHRIRTLVQTLNRYAHEYYTLDAPSVPDAIVEQLELCVDWQLHTVG